MKKSLLLLILGFISTSLLAYSDADMDGVDDSVDKCLGTPFTELVDIQGCSKESLVSPHHFDVVVGANYSDADYRSLNATDTLASSFQVDYYYKNLSLQASTSFFRTQGSGYSDSGMYDSFVGAAYQIQAKDLLSIRLGIGAVLPTYDTSLNNNNTDYTASLNVSYSLKKFNIFGGYAYTLINDDDVTVNGTSYKYQNTDALSAGLGYYFSNKLYMSGSYSFSNSIYDSVEDIQTASVYGYYTIDEHWFSMFSYAKGLSDSASKNYASIKLGYFF